MSDLDEALEQFQRRALEYAGGLANHGPMAAEALSHLGHASLIPGLVDVYAPRLGPLETGDVLPEAERQAALGDPRRMPDWVATFDREIVERPWQEVLGCWVETLLPGLFAAASHGWLRVAHAVRALSEEENSVRKRELALGFAYWAARYQELPGRPSAAPGGGRDVRASFAAVPKPGPQRGFFFDAVRVLDDEARFATVIDSFDPGDAEPSAVLGQIAREGARLYLENPGSRIAYVHCVTAPSALRLVLDHLDENTVRRALGYALQTALALHAVSAGNEPATPDDESVALAENPAEVRYRAACSLEEHAIKFTEACLREDAVASDPVFRLAAADAAIHLDTGDGRGAAC